MSQEKSKLFNIAGIVLALILIIGVKTFAEPCTELIETAMGMEIPMKCHWTAIAIIYLSIGTIILSIANLIKKSKSILEYIGFGILLIAISMDNIGIGICKVDTMPCNFTKTFIIVISSLLILLGIGQLFLKSEAEL